MRYIRLTINGLLVTLLCGSSSLAQTPDSAIARLAKPVAGFYSKYLNNNGIAIRSSTVVEDRALTVAADKISMMLARTPAIKQNLKQWGAEVHIIGKDQQTTDLPEFKHQKGIKFVDNLGKRTDLDNRTRGLGGIYTSCGEENLLGLPQDRYGIGQDICVHEFAHTIMYFGLSNKWQEAIKKQYRKARSLGLWKNTYAMVDAGEYWAELSMWYFDRHGQFLSGSRSPAINYQALKRYDTGGFALLDSIYSGKAKVRPVAVAAPQKVKPNTRTGSADGETVFMVTNRTSKKLKLYWVDTDGKPKLHAEVGPYNSFKCDTYRDHVWLITDSRGKDRGWYKMNKPYLRTIVRR
ncbi:VHL beta domain-containing protein [Mucilaginibacter myungsuensis]|uniref:von Hippel-Lindau disease tumour suppressor beta domain-containing protein n=1 Tax=Mucilaginibacter myungsuensis TaxID=649104 RepID=A0A929L322_9SPHI|nr:hypothetical protein [Mucilaginibacter myungsuensis]MBE9663554.1 hypothetical protein [Mucilaginibacter myungsuensis]MDN3600292.1 hypothetical protein [Mucilaginibacter myungsuensis]